MNKTFAIILIIVVVVGALLALKPRSPSDVQSAKLGSEVATSTTGTASTTGAVPSNKQIVLKSFNFTGYGPGKSHLGTFTDASVSNVNFDASGVPTSGKFTIKTASVKTDNEKLDGHLCNEDFFNCSTNPEIVFDLTSIKAVAETQSQPPTVGATSYEVSGTLTFNKVTQPISFQASGRTTNPPSFSADFKFDTTFFNFKYVGIDKEVRIQFEGEIK